MKFRKHNRIRYLQDHEWFTSIPAGIEFQVVDISDDYVVLQTPDYQGFGNGKILAYGHYVQVKARKAIRAEGKRILEAALPDGAANEQPDRT